MKTAFLAVLVLMNLAFAVSVFRSPHRRAVPSTLMWFLIALGTSQMLRLMQQVPDWSEEPASVRLLEATFVGTTVFIAGGLVMARRVLGEPRNARVPWLIVPTLLAIALAPVASHSKLLLTIAVVVMLPLPVLLLIRQIRYLRGQGPSGRLRADSGLAGRDEERIKEPTLR